MFDTYKAEEESSNSNNTACLTCIYIGKGGYIYYTDLIRSKSASCRLEHSHFKYCKKISPLYRAKLYKHDLPECDWVLNYISKSIKKDPSGDIADNFYEFIHGHEFIQMNDEGGCSWDDFKERFSEVLYVHPKNENFDVLSFERMMLTPYIPEEWVDEIRTSAIAMPIINDNTYTRNIMPLLERASNGGYGIGEYIYYEADWLYGHLIELMNPEADRRIVRIVSQAGVYDATAPHWVKVDVSKDIVTWICHCHYNRWFSEKELPIFRFEISQYKEALEQLKTLAESIDVKQK